MKKVIFLFFLLIVGCSIKEKPYNEIKTIIEQSNGYLIAINYPTTNINPLDKKVLKYIEKTHNDFKQKYKNYNSLSNKPELNITYDYKVINNRYFNIALFTYISNHNNNEIYDIKTFNFDYKKNKFLGISNLFNNLDDLEIKLQKKIPNLSFNKNKLPFVFDDKYIYFYFKSVELSNNKTPIKISLKELNLKIKIKKDKTIIYDKVSKTINKNVIDINKPVIALTFDDGPSKYTNEILDILKQNESVATFFVIGNKVELYNKTLIKMINNGNEIGNHSYSHKLLSRLKPDDIKYQINETQNIVKKITGYTPTHFRPTYGGINDKLRQSTSLKFTLWNIDPKDWKTSDSTTIANRVIEKASDNKIILLHDNHKQSVEAIKIIIPKLKSKGFQFVTVSELDNINLLKEKQ